MNPYLLLLQHLHALITQHLNGEQGPLPAQAYNPQALPVGGAQPAQAVAGPRLAPQAGAQPAQAFNPSPRGIPVGGAAPAQPFNPGPLSGIYSPPGARV